MPRIRTLKPDHRQHRKVGPLDHVTYRLWVGMILEADDEGRLVCDTEQLRVTIFGYHPRVTGALIESSLSRLDKAGLVQLYAMGGLRYAWFPSWRDHQVINRPTPSRLPPYEDSLSDPGGLIEDSLLKGREGNEGNGGERNGTAPAALVVSEGFDTFWAAYPKKRSKDEAKAAWKKLNPDAALQRVMLAAIDQQRRSVDWSRDNGQYIPHPATWINKKRWTDEITAVAPPLMNPRNEAVLRDFVARRGQA